VPGIPSIDYDKDPQHIWQYAMDELKAVQKIEKKLFLQPLSQMITELSYLRRLERAWQLIERDYANPNLSLGKAALASGVSKNHLNVLFRQTTGFTFHQLLVRYRLLMASSMMRVKNYSLLEIA
jgi:AraC-like DNA-binding protein